MINTQDWDQVRNATKQLYMSLAAKELKERQSEIKGIGQLRNVYRTLETSIILPSNVSSLPRLIEKPPLSHLRNRLNTTCK